jgi:alanyl-tRNA synthetase
VLHAIRRKVLGNHITQKGSLVAHDRLRFDISHPNSLTPAEIDLIEDKVNQIIVDNSIVHTKLMSTDSAIESGAMALFGEKYENEVRVVSMGNEDDKYNPYSFELCGGTHVSRTGDIGIFKIVNESAIAAGVRRIEAVCGAYAISCIRENEKLLENIVTTLKSNKQDAVQKVDSLINSKKLLEKDLEKHQLEKLSLTEQEINKIAKNINTIKLVYKHIDNIDAKLLRISVQNTIKNHNNLVLVYSSKLDDKLSLLIGVSKNITQQYNAGNIIKKLSNFIGSSGGGQADLAQAGGGDIKKLASFEKEITRILENGDF